MTTRSEERQENPGKKSRVRLYLFSIALVAALLVIVFLVQQRNKPVFKTRPYKDGVEIIGCESGVGRNLVIPEKIDGKPVRRIGNEAFYNRRSLQNATFPVSLQTIGEDAFSYCVSLTDVSFSRGLQRIDGCAFLGCKSLKRVELPAGLHTIGDSAFSGCNLDVVKLPSTLKTIGADWECSGFEIPENNAHFRTIDGVLFDKEAKVLIVYPAKKAGESYDVPEGVESIGDEAFSHCVSLGSVTLPEGLQTIGNWAFNRCDSLTDVAFPESLRSIGIEAFPRHVKFTAPEGSWAAEWIRARR